MEDEKSNNNRFYLLLVVIILLSFVISYFNYKMVSGSVIPSLNNSTYESILKHTQLLKLLKKKNFKKI